MASSDLERNQVVYGRDLESVNITLSTRRQQRFCLEDFFKRAKKVIYYFGIGILLILFFSLGFVWVPHFLAKYWPNDQIESNRPTSPVLLASSIIKLLSTTNALPSTATTLPSTATTMASTATSMSSASTKVSEKENSVLDIYQRNPLKSFNRSFVEDCFYDENWVKLPLSSVQRQLCPLLGEIPQFDGIAPDNYDLFANLTAAFKADQDFLIDCYTRDLFDPQNACYRFTGIPDTFLERFHLEFNRAQRHHTRIHLLLRQILPEVEDCLYNARQVDSLDCNFFFNPHEEEIKDVVLGDLTERFLIFNRLFKVLSHRRDLEKQHVMHCFWYHQLDDYAPCVGVHNASYLTSVNPTTQSFAFISHRINSIVGDWEFLDNQLAICTIEYYLEGICDPRLNPLGLSGFNATIQVEAHKCLYNRTHFETEQKCREMSHDPKSAFSLKLAQNKGKDCKFNHAKSLNGYPMPPYCLEKMKNAEEKAKFSLMEINRELEQSKKALDVGIPNDWVGF